MINRIVLVAESYMRANPEAVISQIMGGLIGIWIVIWAVKKYRKSGKDDLQTGEINSG